MNLPKLPGTFQTLYLGLGGGYDIFGAIPIHEAIRSEAVFANISNEVESMAKYKPFYQLSNREGPKSLAASLKAIVDEHCIDTIIGVDGGVDCLMHGDEVDPGTVLQDFVTLAAMDQLDAPHKIVVCSGFGSETDEGMNHYRVLENIAQLTKNGAFYGSCSLIGGTPEYACYKDAVESSINIRKSHIQTRVIASVEGQFGDLRVGDPNLAAMVFDTPHEAFVSPLMGIYWFFRHSGIVKNNKIIPHIKDCKTITESLIKYRGVVTRERDKKVIPL